MNEYRTTAEDYSREAKEYAVKQYFLGDLTADEAYAITGDLWSPLIEEIVDGWDI